MLETYSAERTALYGIPGGSGMSGVIDEKFIDRHFLTE
jgi:hypothetical protein